MYHDDSVSVFRVEFFVLALVFFQYLFVFPFLESPPALFPFVCLGYVCRSTSARLLGDH